MLRKTMAHSKFLTGQIEHWIQAAHYFA